MIYNEDVLDRLPKIKSCSQNLIYTDPPYALGSVIVVDEKDNKVKYKSKSDFMSKWEMLSEDQLEVMFQEFYRVLKYGGFCCLWSLNRQSLPFLYYANKAGFEQLQSINSFCISCNDDKTEILTKRGWLTYSDLLNTDEVLTLNTDTNNSEWHTPNDIFTYNVENMDMLNIENQTLSQGVTFNHRILHQNKISMKKNLYSNWIYDEAQNIFNKKHPLVRLASSYPCISEGTYKEFDNVLWWELIGVILTDGYYQKEDNSVRISQSSSKQKNADRIQFLLDELNINYKTYHRDRVYEYKNIKKEYTEYVWYFNDANSIKIKNMFPDKIPSWDILSLDYKNRKALFTGMLLGDGGFPNGGNLYEFMGEGRGSCSLSKNDKLEHYFQALAQTLGYRTIYSYNGKQKKPVVYVSNKHTSEIQSDKYITPFKYTGVVWSINIKNTNYCIRRNGKVSFTGNSFPKAMDLSKALDKYYGEEREVVGKSSTYRPISGKKGYQGESNFRMTDGMEFITSATSDLAKKYDGYKSSIVPLKEVSETLLVFRKPFKYKQIVQDIIAKEENKESDIHGCGIDIEGNRVGFEQQDYDSYKKKRESFNGVIGKAYTEITGSSQMMTSPLNNIIQDENSGRYPSNLYLIDGFNYTPEQIQNILSNKQFHILENIGMDIEPLQYMTEDKQVEYVCNWFDKFEVSKVLDDQSGITKSDALKKGSMINESENIAMSGKNYERILDRDFEANEGGCSRILHKCLYELEEFNLFNYTTKVSQFERNAGCDKLNEKHYSHDGRDKHIENPYQRHDSVAKNNHPTLKPMSLNYKLINLFLCPKEDIKNLKILIPFCGVLSEYIPAMAHGLSEDNIIGIELSEDYCKIGEARREYWLENGFYFKEDKKYFNKIKNEVLKKENEEGKKLINQTKKLF